MEDGGQCVTINGQITPLQWFVDTLDLVILLEVIILYMSSQYERFQLKLFLDTLHIDSAYFISERFGRGTGPIFIDYVNCTGTEPRLWGKCSHFIHMFP